MTEGEQRQINPVCRDFASFIKNPQLFVLPYLLLPASQGLAIIRCSNIAIKDIVLY
jgi:hypothetical protein